MTEQSGERTGESAAVHRVPEESCVFCEICAGRATAHIVRENDLALALLDINPLARGHCLVIPRRHVPWWHQMTGEETTSVFSLARETADRIMTAFKPEFVAMYIRGRRIPHVHVFLVPTNRGEPFDRHFNALEGFQEAATTLSQLRDPAVLADARRQLGG